MAALPIDRRVAPLRQRMLDDMAMPWMRAFEDKPETGTRTTCFETEFDQPIAADPEHGSRSKLRTPQ